MSVQNVTPIRPSEGSYLANVSFYRMPDGDVRAVLEDMASHQIEQLPSITERFFKVSGWAIKGAMDLLRQGLRFDEETRALNDDEVDT